MIGSQGMCDLYKWVQNLCRLKSGTPHFLHCTVYMVVDNNQEQDNVNHEHCHFKFQNRSRDAKVMKGQSEDLVSLLSDHIGPLNILDIEPRMVLIF